MSRKKKEMSEKGYERKDLAKFLEYLLSDFELPEEQFCGGSSCTGLWNYACDDPNHPTGPHGTPRQRAIRYGYEGWDRLLRKLRKELEQPQVEEVLKNEKR